MGESKIKVLMETSSVNLRRAEEASERGEWDDCILHASLAIESAANALIITLGGHEAIDHRAVSALNEVARQKSPDWMKEEKFREMVERGLGVQREVVYSRCPHHADGKWMAPSRYYAKADAEKTLSNAKFVFEVIRGYLKRR
jgi:HEPN domain-containing protein